MVTIKSEREINLMKEAGYIVALAHDAVRKAIKPGVSTKELDKIANMPMPEKDRLYFINYKIN